MGGNTIFDNSDNNYTMKVLESLLYTIIIIEMNLILWVSSGQMRGRGKGSNVIRNVEKLNKFFNDD